MNLNKIDLLHKVSLESLQQYGVSEMTKSINLSKMIPLIKMVREKRGLHLKDAHNAARAAVSYFNNLDRECNTRDFWNFIEGYIRGSCDEFRKMR